ncbi:AAA family ATPase [Aeromonas salmonicida]|uniref:AAA family ATPase n=1 Tax=Aeromonas salmonicida TaxID=645 RepID=UPI00232CDCFA|nr:AAA family ATPase [Aeromonas salmonicida]WCH29181.1 ATP-binding protein [Aeromonas salmonicida]
MAQIEKIEIRNHPVFKQKEIKFKSFNTSENIFTVIIGQNGCGKSELLRVITDSINSQIIKKKSDGVLNYNTMGQVFFKQDIIPDKVLASSFSLNDKFPILTKRNKLYHQDYEYLGLRSTSNNAFVGKYKKEFLSKLVKVIAEEKRTDAFRAVLTTLDMPIKFKFSFKYGRGLKNILDSSSKNISYESFNSFNNKLNNFISNKTNTARFDYEKLHDKLNSYSFKNEMFSFFKNKENKLNTLEYRVDLSNQALNDKFMHDASILIELIDAGIIQINDFAFTADDDFSFSVASSGQHHLYTEMLNLTASITDNSVILIDEPEISLHPNWQIKYISLLQILMSSFKDCHIIICSHSHFLVSCIDESTCNIMQAKRNFSGEVEISEYNQNTYGWSPEQVLYNVFGLSTARNHYFEMDLQKVISVISKVNPNINDIYAPLERIKRFNITDDDPLKLLIERADSFIKETGSV